MMKIKNAGFDPNLTRYVNGNHITLGAVDGLLVRVYYSHDYDLVDGEYQGGACIEKFECPTSNMPIVLDAEDEVILEALNQCDQDYQAKQAGYA